MIKVAILDDSKTARAALRIALETAPEILLVGEAATSIEFYEIIRRFQPDLLCIDVYLDAENGVDIAAEIMQQHPCPIVLVTAINPNDPKLIFKAMECGVLEVFSKLPAASRPDYDDKRLKLIRAIKRLSQVPVLHRKKKRKKISPLGASRSIIAEPGANRPSNLQELTKYSRPPTASRPPRNLPTPSILLIGASTGGPPVIQHLVASIPAPFPIPIVVIQHISAGFAAGFAKWLVQGTRHNSVLVDKETIVSPGTIYIAPDTHHIRFVTAKKLRPVAPIEDDKICPSIDHAFDSAAQIRPREVAAILLTGMGKDGAIGIASLRAGGAYTMVQHPDSCTIASMPQSAIDLGGASEILFPNQIQEKLLDISRRITV